MSNAFGSPLPVPQAYERYPYDHAGYSGAYPVNPGAWRDPPSTGGPNSALEDELPILEELGIDVGAILFKSKAVLLGRVGADSLRDIDMGGPVLFATCLAALHLLHGKLHFGVILGWSAVSYTVFWFTIHQLAGQAPGAAEKECVDLYNCSACLGYCLLPMVLTNCLGVFLPHSSPILAVLFVLASLYSAVLAGNLVTKRAPFLREQLATIVYPAFLYYIMLALISLY